MLFNLETQSSKQLISSGVLLSIEPEGLGSLMKTFHTEDNQTQFGNSKNREITA